MKKSVLGILFGFIMIGAMVSKAAEPVPVLSYKKESSTWSTIITLNSDGSAVEKSVVDGTTYLHPLINIDPAVMKAVLNLTQMNFTLVEKKIENCHAGTTKVYEVYDQQGANPKIFYSSDSCNSLEPFEPNWRGGYMMMLKALVDSLVLYTEFLIPIIG